MRQTIQWSVIATLLSLAQLALSRSFAADWKPAKGRWPRDGRRTCRPTRRCRNIRGRRWFARTGRTSTGFGNSPVARRETTVRRSSTGRSSSLLRRIGAVRRDEAIDNVAERLWYRRTFSVPAEWKGKDVLLHFGAVNWEATVWVNGKKLGEHRGGYDGFEFDITDALKPDGEQEIVVSAWNPTDAGTQPRGKQVRKPGGIFYTPSTGIWQTVWLEPVPRGGPIESVTIVPDVDKNVVHITVNTEVTTPPHCFDLIAHDGDTIINQTAGSANHVIDLRIRNQRQWSPESPFLYGLTVTGKEDSVESYFAMRKASIAKDDKGVTRIFLNNKPQFHDRPARSRVLARRPVHGADRRSPEVRHRNDEEARLQHGPQARQGRARPLVLLVRQARPARLAGHAQRRPHDRPQAAGHHALAGVGQAISSRNCSG